MTGYGPIFRRGGTLADGYGVDDFEGPFAAARIWGGAEQLREAIGAPITPAQRPWYDRRVAAARSVVDDDAAYSIAPGTRGA